MSHLVNHLRYKILGTFLLSFLFFKCSWLVDDIFGFVYTNSKLYNIEDYIKYVFEDHNIVNCYHGEGMLKIWCIIFMKLKYS
jgi:hypothetical protein